MSEQTTPERKESDREYQRILKYIEIKGGDPSAYEDGLAVIYGHIQGGEKDWHGYNREFRKLITGQMRRTAEFKTLERLNEEYKKSLLMDAKVDFDAFLLYVESNRDPKKRFYLPRRDKLLRVVRLLQGLADDKYDIVCVSMPPGTGKSGTAIFYLSWMAGKYPEEPILTGSHSNAFVHGVYEECLRIFDPNGEYLWKDVFPGLSVSSTNAKDLRIDLGKRKRFETLEFTSVGAGNAGLYRAQRLLFCDDLIPGIESAMSKERLDKLWQTYTTDLRQRKVGDHCKELHLATRWSVHDIIGRLSTKYDNDERAKFLVMPALDENDESNFDYKYGVGFTTEFYHEQREVMDDASWKALYMNEPIEREGLLYSSAELRRYFELPDREPDAILSVCDTKDRGTDYCVMPIAYQYGNDYYIEDVVCDNSNPEIVEPRLVEKCLKHKVQMSRFESNSAGGRVAQSVQNEIKNRGGITKITTKYTTQNKVTKIIVQSPFVKEHFLFKDDSITKHDKEYKRFMNFLCSYTMAGKNAHDDVPDAISMLSEYVQSFAQTRVEVFERLW